MAAQTLTIRTPEVFPTVHNNGRVHDAGPGLVFVSRLMAVSPLQCSLRDVDRVPVLSTFR